MLSEVFSPEVCHMSGNKWVMVDFTTLPQTLHAYVHPLLSVCSR